jgi:hypothetical protein
MAEPKTRPTTASVAKYLAAITPPDRRADCEAIAHMLERATGAKPVMWGDAIIGFGSEPIVYANGTSMDWPLMAFASRAQSIVLYNLPSADSFAERLKVIGPAKLQGGCVHIKRLRDVDQQALDELIVAAIRGRQAKTKSTAATVAKPAAKKSATATSKGVANAASKSPAKKVPAKKAPAKKSAAKKSAAKKSSTKKSR